MNWLEKLIGNGNEQDGGTPVIERPPVLDNQKDETPEQPKDFNVLIHNDDNTPFQVVVDVLEQVFSLNSQRAMAIMMAAHTQGKAIVATMAKDMAETKATQAMDLAATHTNPVTKQAVFLQFSTEEA